MGDRTSRRMAAPLLAVLVVWLAGVGIVAAGTWADRGSRATGPEATFLTYAGAVERSDLNTALSLLVPEVRDRASSWVGWQMGNRYRVLEMVVRDASWLDRLAGRADPSAATVVAVLEIEGKGNPTWRAVEEVPARLVDGRWLLAKPPLEGR